MNKKTILITGSNGFIFSNFIRYVVDLYPEYRFVGMDNCIRKHSINNMFKHPNYTFYLADFGNQQIVNNIFKLEKPNIIIHGGAESHVDNSIRDITPFLYTNILGTQCLVNASLQFDVEKFVYISTDEVGGQLQLHEESWTELSSPKPRNPYSVSKYAGELIVYAASETHGLKYNITRSCNNYGDMQQQINLVPIIINCLLNNLPIPIHGDGLNVREWIYVLDNCSAIMNIVKNGKLNEIYNIGSGIEKTNLEITNDIANIMNIEPKISFVNSRKGHDLRYSVDCSKLKQLGWQIQYSFDDAMLKTVNWYKDHLHYYD